jgi:hypothetical protein
LQKLFNLIKEWGRYGMFGLKGSMFNDGWWRAPKFLVRPKKGSTMWKGENSWNLVLLPVSNTKGGERGMLKAPGLD